MNKFFPIMLCILAVSCENQQEKTARLAKAARIAEKESKQQAINAEKARLAQTAKEALFKKLMPQFNLEQDKFTNKVTWRHKTYTHYFNGNGKGIVAEIDNYHFFCWSSYESDDWIFHTAFVVKIGNEQKTFSGYAEHEVIHGIVEHVTPSEPASLELAKFIAESDIKQPVLLRFCGKWTKDIILSQAHRKAITDTYRFFNAMPPNKSSE